MKLFKSQDGIALPVIIAAVVVVLGVGAGAYFVMSKDKDETATTSSSQENKEVSEACNTAIDDKDLCKFAANASFSGAIKSTITTTDADGTSSVYFENDGNGNTRTVATEGGTTSEFIMLGNTTYTKNPDEGNWLKFTYDAPQTDANPAEDAFDIDFGGETGSAGSIAYENLGKEACGNLNCFKYKINDPEETGVEQFVWFDDKDYKLRRYEHNDGTTKTVMTVEYGEVRISEPSPVVEAPAIDADIQSQIDAALDSIGQ